ncbi:response regulator transcription factor [Naumannella sp. ID2617S]|uniref:DNA-binding response regulator n=1 Tax=Enemella dayhoffiae TaxID=2016507 RepID=A0A255GYL0_9ACTN|nr:response regulator transcription factor [Naumannella sp. ID2617S]OYO18724.1 DNA-binding response regulator [Enemella dayhoffiae]
MLLVDDDPMARAGVRQILTQDPRIEVVAEVSDGDQVVEACQRHSPDVVLMDLRMQRVNGIEATATVRRQVRPPQVIALTSFDLDQYVYAALAAGAAGFLLKDASPEDLRRSVHTVFAGDAVLSPRSTRHLLNHFSQTEAGRGQLRRQSAETFAGLSDREQEIARLVWQGLSNREIAARLFLGEATVKTHLARLMAKVDADSRVQVALLVERAS